MSSAEPRAAAVVVAGGSGRRIGGPVRKQYLEVGGIPVILRAVMPFILHPRIHPVVVVLPPDDVEHPPVWFDGVTLVAGGAERGDSVWNGLQAVGDADVVLVHDAARPFVTREIIDRVLDACRNGTGAVAAVPVTDTIKQVAEDGTITGTPERARLWQAQTPQGFPLRRLIEAYHLARQQGVIATDDAAVYERCGGVVRVVAGSPRNIKVTRPEDLLMARALALAPEAGGSE